MKRIVLISVCIFCLIGNVFSQYKFFGENSNIEKWYIENDNLAAEVKKVMNLPEFNTITRGKISSDDL